MGCDGAGMTRVRSVRAPSRTRAMNRSPKSGADRRAGVGLRNVRGLNGVVAAAQSAERDLAVDDGETTFEEDPAFRRGRRWPRSGTPRSANLQRCGTRRCPRGTRTSRGPARLVPSAEHRAAARPGDRQRRPGSRSPQSRRRAVRSAPGHRSSARTRRTSSHARGSGRRGRTGTTTGPSRCWTAGGCRSRTARRRIHPRGRSPRRGCHRTGSRAAPHRDVGRRTVSNAAGSSSRRSAVTPTNTAATRPMPARTRTARPRRLERMQPNCRAPVRCIEESA